MTIRNLRGNNDTNNGYFDWLCRRVRASSTWSQALRQMHNTPFKTLVKYDENRREDGKNLRYLYEQAHEEDPEHIPPLTKAEDQAAVSIFEMMVALADRLAFDVDDDKLDGPAAFWILMENVGLSKNFNQNSAILQRLNNRTYSWNGSNGGLFPLKDTERDQREVEIWYQLQEYSMENWPL